MISVPIDRIVPLTDARDNFSRLISDIETLSDGLYVLTKGGKPAIALINIKYLEEIMTSGPAANHQARIANHESDHKPEVSHKVHEPIHRPAPVKLPEPPKPPIIPKPNFEVPRITTAPISPTTPLPSIPSTPLGVNGDNTPKVALPFSNYDVKPTVNPTWTGEEAKINQPSAVSPSTALPSTQLGVNNQQSASIGAPAASPTPPPPLPPIAQLDKPFSLPPPPTPSKPFDSAQGKPVINPWPIIPPRSPQVTEKGYESSTTIPPRATSEQGIRDTSTVPPRPTPPAQPSASNSLAPSQNSIPPAPTAVPVASSPSTPSTGLGTGGLGVNPPPVASLPEASFPKMVAPPPPPPPSSLPRIPSSFQTVPVPINGSKPTTTPPVPLPPPPITTAPAPFADTSPAAPIVTPSTPLPSTGLGVNDINPKPADSIAFDQPPTTIPEPGEDLPMPSAAKTDPPAVSTPTPPTSPAPATPPPSVQDLEI